MKGHTTLRSIVIYDSLSGNTERVARAIGAGIEATAGRCDIVRIGDADPRRLRDYDLIGLGSPVMGGVPDNVKMFVNAMNSVGGKHAFAFCTHGALPMLYFPIMYPLLKDKGLAVIGFHSWYCDSWLAHCTKPYFTEGHPDEIDLAEARTFGAEMVKASQTIAAGGDVLELEPPALPSAIDMPPLPEFMGVFPSKLKFHRESCLQPKCHLCVDVCPVYGIDLSVSPPVLATPCIECEMCTKVCPTGAMEAYDYYAWLLPLFYNSMRLAFFPAVRKAEARGDFRRLVPEEDLGWATPVAKMMLENRDKHPYFLARRGYTFTRSRGQGRKA